MQTLTLPHRAGYSSAIAAPFLIEHSDKPTVLCVKWGRKYGADYVNRLFSMVRRQLSIPHRFICLTDDPNGLEPTIQTVPLPPSSLEFCWSKLWIFSPGLAPAGSTLLYLDLDVVVTDGLDELLEYRSALDFVSVLDWNRWWSSQFNSSVMRFVAGAHADLYKHFLEAVEAGKLVKKREWDECLQSRDKVVYWRGLRRYGSDQEWISRQLRQQGRLGERSYPGPWILSYKRHCRKGLPAGAKVIVFHGEPKPHEVRDEHIVRHWK